MKKLITYLLLLTAVSAFGQSKLNINQLPPIPSDSVKNTDAYVTHVTWSGIALNAHAVAHNGYLYVCEHQNNKVAIFDISNNASPVLVGEFSTGTHPRSLAFVNDKLVVVCRGSNNITFYDVSNPASVTTISSTPTDSEPMDIEVVNDKIYVICATTGKLDKFVWYDTGTYIKADLVGVVSTAATPVEMDYRNGIIAVVGSSSTLDLYVESSLSHSTYTFTGTVFGDVKMYGANVLATDFSRSKLVVIDITNLSTPAYVTEISMSPNPNEIQIVGQRAYIPSLTNSPTVGALDCVDLTNPKTPIKYKTITATGSGGGFSAVSGEYLYVTCHFTPFYLDIFKITPPVYDANKFDVNKQVKYPYNLTQKSLTLLGDTVNLRSIQINAPNYSGISSSYKLTLPSSAGSANQLLTTQGNNAQMTWTTPLTMVNGVVNTTGYTLGVGETSLGDAILGVKSSVNQTGQFRVKNTNNTAYAYMGNFGNVNYVSVNGWYNSGWHYDDSGYGVALFNIAALSNGSEINFQTASAAATPPSNAVHIDRLGWTGFGTTTDISGIGARVNINGNFYSSGTGIMNGLKLTGATSGGVTFTPDAVAGTTTITVKAVAGTMALQKVGAISSTSGGTTSITYNTIYIYSGSGQIYQLPAISSSLTYDLGTIVIKNRGSGNITLNSNAGGNDIYDTAAVSTLTIAPGAMVTLINDGTYFNKL